MDLHLLFYQGSYPQTIELAVQMATPEAMLVGAQAAIAMADYPLAEQLLQQPLSDPTLEAERTALTGILHYYRGDPASFRKLALQAAQRAPTFLTLYCLSRSQPPEQGLLVLQEAMQLARRPGEVSQVSMAMARSYARLGRYREALYHASLAQLRSPGHAFVVTWAKFALYGSDDIPLERLIDQVAPYQHHESRGVRIDALHVLAELHLMLQQVQQARDLYEKALALMDNPQLPFMAPLGLRIYRALGDTDRIDQIILATRVAATSSQLHQGMAALVMGQSLFPDPQGTPHLEKACRLLAEESPLEALKAQVYLNVLAQQPLSTELTLKLEQWSQRARNTLPQSLTTPFQKLHRLQVMGNTTLTSPNGAIPLRPRSLDLLVLLVAHPAGIDRDILSELLYGRYTPRALHTELIRLRSALGGGVEPDPWQLTLPIWADFLELRTRLQQGNLSGALQLYRGPLLPQSRAPGIEELRSALEDELRTAIITRGDLELLHQLGQIWPDDLELWETLLGRTPNHDPRHPAVLARVRRLQREYTA